MQRDAKITSEGIKKVLKNYKPYSAFAEYIWNGFDAGATRVEVNINADNLGRISSIEVLDNGEGIDLSELDVKFEKFYDSEKSLKLQTPKHSSITHGKNGVGRLTFFTFAHSAKWDTIFEKDGFKRGEIKISADNLKRYEDAILETDLQKTQTTVSFTNVQINYYLFDIEIIPYLRKEFCWFLELNRDCTIFINGEPLDYSSLIVERVEFPIYENGENFEVRYVQWDELLNKEHSKFYFVNKEGKEVYKDFTTLNKKGDNFYHSVFIKSDFFGNFDFAVNEESSQQSLLYKAKSSPEYKSLIKKLNEFLRNKRKPYLRTYAIKMVEEYEDKGIMPIYENSWEQLRSKELKETIIGLYEVQPKIFSNLNLEQKKTFVRFLDLLLDSNERENVFKIIDEVTNLDSDERADLASILHKTTLSRIVNTLKLIEDRYKTYYQLRELVFNDELGAKEVPHLQDIIESHYWIFGEEYHLVTAAEPKFEEALKRYLFKTTGEIKDTQIEHPEKSREMDIFACRQCHKDGKIENIVVELKHPRINLGEKEYSQVMKYLGVISSKDEFNAPNMTWKFILVGNRFDTSKFIERQIKTNINHGEESLVFNENGRIKVYIKTWSEIFSEFELRHNFLDQRLKLKREKLFEESKEADEIVAKAKNNSATAPVEIKVPKK